MVKILVMYVFTRQGLGDWSEQRLMPTTPSQGSFFGATVAAKITGRFVVGAPGHNNANLSTGTVYIYGADEEIEENSYQQQRVDTETLGRVWLCTQTAYSLVTVVSLEATRYKYGRAAYFFDPVPQCFLVKATMRVLATVKRAPQRAVTNVMSTKTVETAFAKQRLHLLG